MKRGTDVWLVIQPLVTEVRETTSTTGVSSAPSTQHPTSTFILEVPRRTDKQNKQQDGGVSVQHNTKRCGAWPPSPVVFPERLRPVRSMFFVLLRKHQPHLHWVKPETSSHRCHPSPWPLTLRVPVKDQRSAHASKRLTDDDDGDDWLFMVDDWWMVDSSSSSSSSSFFRTWYIFNSDHLSCFQNFNIFFDCLRQGWCGRESFRSTTLSHIATSWSYRTNKYRCPPVNHNTKNKQTTDWLGYVVNVIRWKTYLWKPELTSPSWSSRVVEEQDADVSPHTLETWSHGEGSNPTGRAVINHNKHSQVSAPVSTASTSGLCQLLKWTEISLLL